MNNKDREEKIQLILDGKLDDENELSQDERRELNGHRKLDSLLSEAFSNSDVDTTPLEGFVPYKRERRSFPLPQLHLVAAAAVIIIVAAASFFFLYTSAPEGDGAKLARYREAALNGEAAPPVLEQSQKQYLDYLADFYGSYAKLSPDKLRDELNAAWEQSCVNAFERVLTETENTPASIRIAEIEYTARQAQGNVSEPALKAYRASAEVVLQSIEESFEGWRSGDEVNVEWAADGWGNSASLFVNATERDKRTCWLAYRAFVDGAPVEDIQRHYEKVPSHLLLPLAELSSYAVARKFTFTPALDESDVLAELAAKVLDSNEDDLESIAASAYMTQNALYTALFYHGRAMGPRLNKLVTTAHNLFSASEEYLTRQRIDATPVVEPLSKAFKLNNDYLFTNTSAYPVHRYWTLTTTAADLPPQQLDEWNDFLRRINFVRACAGKQLISTAFKTKGDYEVFSTTLEGLRTRTMDTDFFAGFLHGDFNRASPTFSGARVEVKCFSDNGAVALPNNQHVPEGLKTNADVPGNF